MKTFEYEKKPHYHVDDYDYWSTSYDIMPIPLFECRTKVKDGKKRSICKTEYLAPAKTPARKRLRMWDAMEMGTKEMTSGKDLVETDAPLVSLTQFLRESLRSTCKYQTEELLPIVERTRYSLDGFPITLSNWYTESGYGELPPDFANAKNIHPLMLKRLKDKKLIVEICSKKGKASEYSRSECFEKLYALHPFVKSTGLFEWLAKVGLNWELDFDSSLSPKECQDMGGTLHSAGTKHNQSRTCSFPVCGIPMDIRKKIVKKGYYLKEDDAENAYQERSGIEVFSPISEILDGEELEKYNEHQSPIPLPKLEQAEETLKSKETSAVTLSGSPQPVPATYFEQPDMRYVQGKWIQSELVKCQKEEKKKGPDFMLINPNYYEYCKKLHLIIDTEDDEYEI